MSKFLFRKNQSSATFESQQINLHECNGFCQMVFILDLIGLLGTVFAGRAYTFPEWPSEVAE